MKFEHNRVGGMSGICLLMASTLLKLYNKNQNIKSLLESIPDLRRPLLRGVISADEAETLMYEADVDG